MNFLILSDTHGHSDRIAKLLSRPSVRPDAILFAGDGVRDFEGLSLPCPLFAVKGNNDWSTTAPASMTLELEGLRIYLTHGHAQGVKYGLDALAGHARANGIDVAIYGHTHRRQESCLQAEEGRPLWLFNPGSLGDAEASFGTLTIRGGQVLFGFGSLQ